MPEYKTVRLELHVYRELQSRMKPQESMSQALERVLNHYDEAYGHAKAIVQVMENALSWSKPN